MLASGTIDHDQRVQRRIAARLAVEARTKLRVGDRNGCSGIGEIELQQIGRRQRVDQQRHKTGAHRAEKGRRIGGRVVEEQQDAVAASQPERGKAVPPARRVRAEFGIAALARGTLQRELRAVSFGKVVEQNAACIVARRNRKADLARPRTVRRHLVIDFGRHVRLPLVSPHRKPP